MCEPRVLLIVSQQEYNLESRYVDIQDVLCRHFRVGGEERNSGLSLFSVFHTVDNDHAPRRRQCRGWPSCLLYSLGCPEQAFDFIPLFQGPVHVVLGLADS